MKLPPPEAPAADIVAYMDALEDECMRDPNRAAWDMSKQRWLDLYTGNHFADAVKNPTTLEPEQLSSRSASTVCRLVYNRVMNAVLAMLAGQISNPPKTVFGARENGEPPIYYLNGFVQHPALQQIAIQAGMMDPQVQELDALYGRQQVMQPQPAVDDQGQPGQPQVVDQLHAQTAQAAIQAGQSIPLPPELADQVKMMIDQGKMLTAQARMAGLPPPLGIVPPEALVEITDQTTASFTQTIYDGLWEQCGGVEATAENILNKKVLGWQPTLFESDRSKIAYGEPPITLTNVEGSQVYFDPATSSYRPPRHAIMKEPVTYEEVRAEYPDLVGQIEFSPGRLKSRNGDSGRLIDLDSARDRCLVRTLWIRDWPYPMDPDEALACGKMSVQSVPTGEMEDAAYDSTGTVVGQRPVMRQTMVSQESGEQDVTPGHPSWPIVYGTREIRDINGFIIFDRRRKGPFPITNNINIPVPFSPYGLGEPDRLDGLQMAVNRVLSDLVTQHRYSAYPTEVRHQAVSDGLAVQLRKTRSAPNTVVNVPPSVAALVGNDLSKLVQYVVTPAVAAEAWQLLEFLVEAIDKEANNTDVQQGQAPAGSSGQWVANLQAAANQVAQVTSQATEAWLKQVVRLFVHFITNEMTVEDVQKYTNKYPPAILEAFKRRQKALYLDISVEIQSGSAAAKQGQTQSLVAAKQAGVMVSDPELMTRMNIDPDDQLQQQSAWLQKMRESGILDAQAEQQQPGQKKKQEPSSSE